MQRLHFGGVVHCLCWSTQRGLHRTQACTELLQRDINCLWITRDARWSWHHLRHGEPCLWKVAGMDFVDLRQSHSAAQAALDLMVILLPQPPKCYDHRCGLPCLARYWPFGKDSQMTLCQNVFPNHVVLRFFFTLTNEKGCLLEAIKWVILQHSEYRNRWDSFIFIVRQTFGKNTSPFSRNLFMLWKF